MALAVYVHIPYCLQRCRYCDFATFEWSEILPPEQYVSQILREIRSRREFWPQTEIRTLYFGGGTPSLIAPELIVAIKTELANSGFRFLPNAELTLEINPATLDEKKLNSYVSAGFNRFSVGAQTFDEDLLRACGRKHNATDTHETLKLLRKYDLNYSFDLLFALPGQSLRGLDEDLAIVCDYSPPHLSAYCLTVPEGHPMATGRAPEDEQVEMFAHIERRLKTAGLEKYEISNFARSGFESRHNRVYWEDESYWGIGLSSHSYMREFGPHGLRFWNSKNLKTYEHQTQAIGANFTQLLPPDQYELLHLHESMTDYCHMHLRTMFGLPEDALQKKFSSDAVEAIQQRLQRLKISRLVERLEERWRLTSHGQLVSNKVFEELTFLAADRPSPTLTPAAGDSYCAI